MSKFIIQDWAGNRLFPNKEFNSFDEGWAFIDANVEEETENDDTFDDYFVVPLT